jgi:hypothetical protein
LKKKKWKHEIGRTWNLTSSCCVVCVSPTSYKNKNKNTMNIYVKISKQEIRVSNTPFSRNRAWKRDFKHSFVFSSLKKYLFTCVCYKAEWTQLKSIKLVLGTSNVHWRTNCTSPWPLKQMINEFFYYIQANCIS